MPTTIGTLAINVTDRERLRVTLAFVRDPDGHLVELGQQRT